MRVLYLTYASPMPPVDGGRMRQAAFVRALSRHHEVDLLSFDDPAVPPDRGALSACRSVRFVERKSLGASRAPAARWLRSLKRRVSRVPTLRGTYAAPMALAVRDQLARESYELAVADSLYMARYLVDAPLAKILDLSDLMSLTVERERDATKSWLRRRLLDAHRGKLAAAELELGRAYDRVLLPTEEEARRLCDALGLETVHVVPNAFDLALYPDEPEAPLEPKSILFCGAMDYYPNVDAVVWFARAILPRIREAVPEAKLLVVGKSPPPDVQALRSPTIEVTGFVPDTRPWYRRASVAIAPMRLGGGTRLKILEAMAAWRPVVATSFGASGLGTADEQPLRLADDPDAFARAVASLLGDRRKRERLARAARKFLESRFDAEVVGRAFVELCEATASPRAAVGSARARP